MKKIAILLLFILVIISGARAQSGIITYGDFWKYLDDGSNQGTAWRSTSFNDAGWSSGQAMFGYDIVGVNTFINYGPNHKNKFITTYFRKVITLEAPDNYVSFTANIKRDDGIVVYVNGTEIIRNNMPAGTITNTTLAYSARDNGEDEQVFTLSPSVFVSGENVLAVEVHQQKLNSSDLAFDMELLAERRVLDNAPPTVVSINRYSPETNETSASSLTYELTFSESVVGVDPTDFFVATASGTATGVLAADAVAQAGTNGSVYHVTVSAITGEGDLRLSLHSSDTQIKDVAGNAINGGYTHGQLYTITSTPPPPPPSSTGFSTVTSLNTLPISTNTAEKPQSKVWQYDGKWWAVLTDVDGTHVWKLSGTTWVKALTLTSSSFGRADCKVVGNLVHILVFRGNSSSYLYSIEYKPASGTYFRWATRTARVPISVGTEAETATLEVDGAGRMWVAYDALNATGTHDIYVKWSDAPYSSWSSAITLATNVINGDICGIIALPNKIGVFWSNQNTKRFGFRTHADGASPTSWSADEAPGASSALDIRAGLADDHLNMAVASDGTLYSAIKTGYDTPGYTKLGLLVRRPSGSWDNIYDVSTQEGTRPMVILNEAAGKIKVVYTEFEQSGDILYRESSTTNIAFSGPMVLISGVYNFATSSKNNYTNEVIILASNVTQAVGVIGVDAPSGTATDLAKNTTPNSAFNEKEALMSGNELQLYPNPFSTSLQLRVVLSQDSDFTATFYDGKGQEVPVLSRRGSARAGEEQLITLDGSQLSPGLYFLKLQTQSGTKTIRVMRSQ